MNRKIIEDISWIITLILVHVFYSTYIPKYPIVSKTKNKSKSRVRERDN